MEWGAIEIDDIISHGGRAAQGTGNGGIKTFLSRRFCSESESGHWQRKAPRNSDVKCATRGWHPLLPCVHIHRDPGLAWQARKRREPGRASRPGGEVEWQQGLPVT